MVSQASSLLPADLEHNNEYGYLGLYQKSAKNASVLDHSSDLSLTEQVNAFGADEDSFVETHRMLTNIREKEYLEDFFLESEKAPFTADSSKKHRSNSREKLLGIMQSDAFKCGSDLVATPSYASVSRFDSQSKTPGAPREQSNSSRPDSSADNSDKSKKLQSHLAVTSGQRVNEFISSLIQPEQSGVLTLANNRSESSSSHSSTADGKGFSNRIAEGRYISPYPTPKSEPDSREIDKTQQSDLSRNQLLKNGNEKSTPLLKEPQYYLQNSAKRHLSKEQVKFDVVLHSECTNPSKSPNQTDLSDSIQEKEVRISFKVDPDSRQSPITTPVNNGDKLKSRLNALPGVRPISFTKEGLENLERKTKLIAQQMKSKQENDPLTSFRKRSVGKKLKEAMMRYNTRGGLVQPFKKKAQSNQIAAENSSKKSSRHPSPANVTLSRIRREASGSKQRKASSIAETLNAIMNRQRGASSGSRDSSRSRICSSSIVKSIIQPMDKILNGSAANSEKGSVESRRKNLLHLASNKSSRLNSLQRPHAEVAAKSPLEPADSQHKADNSRHLQKSASNSTNRLFNRIFRRDIELTGRSLEGSHVDAVDNKGADKSSKRTYSQKEELDHPEPAERSRVVGLDSLIQKMYQAGNSRVLSEQYLGAEREAGIKSDRNFESQSDLFRTEASTFGAKSHRGPREDHVFNLRKLSNPLFQKEPLSSREGRPSAIQEKLTTSRNRLRQDRAGGPQTDRQAADQTRDLQKSTAKHSSILTDKVLQLDLNTKAIPRQQRKQEAQGEPTPKEPATLKSLALPNARPALKSTRTSPLPRALYSEGLLHSASNTNYLPQSGKPAKSPICEKREPRDPHLDAARTPSSRQPAARLSGASSGIPSHIFGAAPKESSGGAKPPRAQH